MQRSADALAYRRLYNTSRWRAMRTRHLAMQPLCERCASVGRVVSATVVHHVVPHKGDEELFFGGALQSLCAPCHDGPVQSDERRGYAVDVGTDGWPIDRDHPAYGV